MIRPLSHIQRAMRDLFGSWDRVDEEWQQRRDDGRIIEHRIGPESALYELPADDVVISWLLVVDAQLALRAD
jgi:hypothetical protein